MLNPPLSLLSDELLSCIVGHVAKLPFANTHLRRLSLTDRAFTHHCQACIFRVLALGGRAGTKNKILSKLQVVEEILNAKPIVAKRVRVIDLYISQKQNAWLFNDAIFLNVLHLLSEAQRPPHELHFSGPLSFPLKLQDPVHFVERLHLSFFSRSLTCLHLKECKNVPLTVFLVCPRLKEVLLDAVGAAEETYTSYPETHITGREAPALEYLDYRDAHSLIEQMINLPPKLGSPVVLWSQLRVLTLSPHEKAGMTRLQSILDAAFNSLEELYLTNLEVGLNQQFPLASLIDLRKISVLRVFALFATMRCGADESWVVRDINSVLSTIQTSNKVTNLSLHFTIFGQQTFEDCSDQDWAGLCEQVIRISDAKPLEFDLKVGISTGMIGEQDPSAEGMYADVLDKMGALSNYPNVCLHYWNPTKWRLGLGPPPRGQVRGRCRR